LIHFYKRMKMLVLAILLAVFATVQGEIELENGVMVLNADNFDAAVADNNILLVEFYAPWCGHCKKLEPEYASAAKTLQDDGSPAKLAKVDATENKDLANKFGVKGYPTLKFFKDGTPLEYTGGRTADTIVAWLNKKTGPPAVVLDSAEAADAIQAKNKAVVVGFFKDPESAEAKEYLSAASTLEDQVFAIVSDEAMFSKLEVKADNTVIVLRKFPGEEPRAVMEGEISAAAVTDFVGANALPLVSDFNQDTAKTIFGTSIGGHLIIFGSAKDDGHEQRLHNARKVAKDYRGKVMFVSVTTDEEEHKRVLDFFGIWDTPTFRIANVQQDFVKYKPETNDFSEENLRGFVEKYLAGSLVPDLKTAELPQDWDAAPVKVLVGSNFADVAMDATKDVLVEFYAPWCGHCKKLAPIWDDLGAKFEDVEDVIIAKMDATVNEVKDIKVNGFPTIKLFRKETNEMVDYKGGRALDDFVGFLRPEMLKTEETEAEAEADPAPKEEL